MGCIPHFGLYSIFFWVMGYIQFGLYSIWVVYPILKFYTLGPANRMGNKPSRENPRNSKFKRAAKIAGDLSSRK